MGKIATPDIARRPCALVTAPATVPEQPVGSGDVNDLHRPGRTVDQRDRRRRDTECSGHRYQRRGRRLAVHRPGTFPDHQRPALIAPTPGRADPGRTQMLIRTIPVCLRDAAPGRGTALLRQRPSSPWDTDAPNVMSALGPRLPS